MGRFFFYEKVHRSTNILFLPSGHGRRGGIRSKSYGQMDALMRAVYGGVWRIRIQQDSGKLSA